MNDFCRVTAIGFIALLGACVTQDTTTTSAQPAAGEPMSTQELLGSYEGSWNKTGTSHSGSMCFTIKEGPAGPIATVVVIDSDPARTRYTWVSDVSFGADESQQTVTLDRRDSDRIDTYVVQSDGSLAGSYVHEGRPWGKAQLDPANDCSL